MGYFSTLRTETICAGEVRSGKLMVGEKNVAVVLDKLLDRLVVLEAKMKSIEPALKIFGDKITDIELQLHEINQEICDLKPPAKVPAPKFEEDPDIIIQKP